MTPTFSVGFDGGEESWAWSGLITTRGSTSVGGALPGPADVVSGLSERTPISHAYSIALCKIIRLRVAVAAAALDPVLVWVIRVSRSRTSRLRVAGSLNASIWTVWPVSQAIAGRSWSGGSGLSRMRVL